jgi:hypothetical protein
VEADWQKKLRAEAEARRARASTEAAFQALEQEAGGREEGITRPIEDEPEDKAKIAAAGEGEAEEAASPPAAEGAPAAAAATTADEASKAVPAAKAAPKKKAAPKAAKSASKPAEGAPEAPAGGEG